MWFSFFRSLRFHKSCMKDKFVTVYFGLYFLLKLGEPRDGHFYLCGYLNVCMRKYWICFGVRKILFKENVFQNKYRLFYTTSAFWQQSNVNNLKYITIQNVNANKLNWKLNNWENFLCWEQVFWLSLKRLWLNKLLFTFASCRGLWSPQFVLGSRLFKSF